MNFTWNPNAQDEVMSRPIRQFLERNDVYAWQHWFPTEIIDNYSVKAKRFNTIIDVGACYGFMSYPFALHSKRVIAFEPDQNVLPYLKDNMSNLPKKSAEYILHEEALTLENRFDNLYPYILDVDLVKIDVDGVELEVLWGMKETLQYHKPTVICEIYLGRKPHVSNRRKRTVNFMRSLGYHVVDVRQQDWIFKHKDRL